jgi:hypothetical protein
MRFFIALALVGILLVITFPVWFSLQTSFYGRIVETMFWASLHQGMTKDQVITLRRWTFGEKGLYDYPGTLTVTYADFDVFPCISSGNSFTFYFDSSDRVKYWHLEPWTDSC